MLCEKSITLNSEELAEAINLLKENHVKLAEAMTISICLLIGNSEIVASGKLASHVIQMNFGSYKEYDMTNRFQSQSGSGLYWISFTFLSSCVDL